MSDAFTLPDADAEAQARARDYRTMISAGWLASVACIVISDNNARRRFFGDRDQLEEHLGGKHGGLEVERRGIAKCLWLPGKTLGRSRAHL